MSSRVLSAERSRKYFATPRGGLRRVWHGMINRCHNPKFKAYIHYGGRGIEVCSEWRKSFETFFRWATENNWQHGLEVDRADNNKGYSPANCRLVTRSENLRNQRSTRGTSQYVGVIFEKARGKWRAGYKLNRKAIMIGRFDTEEEAAAARDAVAVPLGFRANLS